MAAAAVIMLVAAACGRGDDPPQTAPSPAPPAAPAGKPLAPNEITTLPGWKSLEPEPAVVRRIFTDYVAGGHSMREISRRLADDQVPTPRSKRGVWGVSTLGRLLRNEAYVGRVYFNRAETVIRAGPLSRNAAPWAGPKNSHRWPETCTSGSPSRYFP